MRDVARPIILLEDDATLRDLMADALVEAGYGVTATATATHAMMALEAVAGEAILIADRALDDDGPNGFQVAAEAMARFSALRVVYISGTHIAIRRRTLSEQERGLLKPFAMTQLLGAVRELSR